MINKDLGVASRISNASNSTQVSSVEDNIIEIPEPKSNSGRSSCVFVNSDLNQDMDHKMEVDELSQAIEGQFNFWADISTDMPNVAFHNQNNDV